MFGDHNTQRKPTLMKPISLAYSLKHCLQMFILYFRIKPWRLAQTRLSKTIRNKNKNKKKPMLALTELNKLPIIHTIVWILVHIVLDGCCKHLRESWSTNNRKEKGSKIFAFFHFPSASKFIHRNHQNWKSIKKASFFRAITCDVGALNAACITLGQILRHLVMYWTLLKRSMINWYKRAIGINFNEMIMSESVRKFYFVLR